MQQGDRSVATDPVVAPARRTREWAQALGLVVLWYVVAQAASAYFLGVAPGREAWLRDLLAHLLLGGVLFAMARGVLRFGVAMVLLFTAFTLGNALKLALLGGPVMPDDFSAARNLFMLLDGWQLWGSAAMLALPLAGLAWMFAWRSARLGRARRRGRRPRGGGAAAGAGVCLAGRALR